MSTSPSMPITRTVARGRAGHSRRPSTLAVHARIPGAAGSIENLAGRVDHLLAAAHWRPPTRLQREAQHDEQERGARRRDRADQRPRNAVAGNIGVDQHDRADHEGRNAAHAEDAEARHEMLCDHQAHAERNQHEAGVIDRQQLQGEEPEHQANPADHARCNEARTVELEQQAVETDHEQQVGDARIGDDRRGSACASRARISTITAPAVASRCSASKHLNLAAVELFQELRHVAAIRSITLILSASCAERLTASRTACSAQSALRPRSCASPRM